MKEEFLQKLQEFVNLSRELAVLFAQLSPEEQRIVEKVFLEARDGLKKEKTE